MGGAKAHYDGIVAFSQTDFTEDLKKITVPVLVMHGDDDQIVPYRRLGAAVGRSCCRTGRSRCTRASRTACAPPTPTSSTPTCWPGSEPDRRTQRGRVASAAVSRVAAALRVRAAVAIAGEIPRRRLWHAAPAFPTVSEVWLRLPEQAGR